MKSRTDRLTVATLSAGHFINDAYSNLLSPLLPLLITRVGFSLSKAGLLGGVLLFSSSLMQPVYGYLGDRYVRRAFAIYAPLLTAVCMSSLGIASSYTEILFLVVLGGVGIAAFHPQGASLVSQASSLRPAFGMSIFVTSGSIGYGLGPTVVGSLIFSLGLERSYLAAIPGLVICLLLSRAVPSSLSSIKPKDVIEKDSWGTVWKPLSLLCLLVVIRSGVQFGLTQFLPLYFTQQGYSLRESTWFLTIFLLCGGFGGFWGGYIADRFGGKQLLSYSMLVSCPMLLAFLHLSGIWSVVSLGLSGLVLLSTLPVSVVLGQELAPHRTSTVSALMMGFAWGIGGMAFVPLTGIVGEMAGLDFAFGLLALLPLAGYLVSLWIPEKKS